MTFSSCQRLVVTTGNLGNELFLGDRCGACVCVCVVEQLCVRSVPVLFNCHLFPSVFYEFVWFVVLQNLRSEEVGYSL